MADAKVKINICEGVFEFEGNESFIEQQMIRFEGLISSSFAKASPQNRNKGDIDLNEVKNFSTSNTEEEQREVDNLDNLFEIHEGKPHIIKDIPGSNIKAQTIAAALLVCICNLKTGAESVLLDDIRSECERHGFYNPKKFAEYVRSYTGLFLESGSGKETTLKLTVPGRKLAQELVSKLNKNDIGDFFSKMRSRPTAKASYKRNGSSTSVDAKKSPPTSGRPGPGAMIQSLLSGGYFNEKKGPADVVNHCKESKVLSYNNTEISVALGRAVRSGKLKREKTKDGQYAYIKS